MHEIIDAFLNKAQSKGIDYADIRVIDRRRESITVRDGRVDNYLDSTDAGIGVRVLHKGRWGYAASHNIDAREAAMITETALRISEASSRAGGEATRLDEIEVHEDDCATPVEADPFAVPLEDKLARLMDCDERMAKAAALSHRQAFYDAWREDQHFASTEGAKIHQVVTECGGGIQADAIKDGDHQVRCFPNSFRGQFHTGGYEQFMRYDLEGECARVAEEAVQLLAAPPVPDEVTTIIIDGPQLGLQIHESIGHAIELDRVLGWELAYAGGSFVKHDDPGRLRYGSEIMHVTLDPTLSGGLGSYMYDDDGTKAFRTDLIKDGILTGFMSGRDSAGACGQRTTACNRSDGFARLPIVRMANVNLEPGNYTLEELIGSTKKGYLFSNNRSWSIDDHRVNFQFGCEAAWEIIDGKLGRMFRNPNYTGITTEFWGNYSGSCNADHWNIWGTPNCGKGQPGQTAHVAHGCAPSRFDNVRVGVRG